MIVPDGRDPRFAVECHRTWESLEPTADPDVAHCGECARDVHRCTTEREAAVHGSQGRCVALPRKTPRFPIPAVRPGSKTMTIGMPGPGIPTTAWLVPLDGPQAHESFLLGARTTIGRGPADIILDDDSLEPEHAVVVGGPNGHVLRDARPGGCADPIASRDLVDGDRFVLGRTPLVFKTVLT